MLGAVLGFALPATEGTSRVRTFLGEAGSLSSMLLLPSPHLNHEVSNNFGFLFFPFFFFFFGLFLDKNFGENKKKKEKF